MFNELSAQCAIVKALQKVPTKSNRPKTFAHINKSQNFIFHNFSVNSFFRMYSFAIVSMNSKSASRFAFFEFLKEQKNLAHISTFLLTLKPKSHETAECKAFVMNMS